MDRFALDVFPTAGNISTSNISELKHVVKFWRLDGADLVDFIYRGEGPGNDTPQPHIIIISMMYLVSSRRPFC